MKKMALFSMMMLLVGSLLGCSSSETATPAPSKESTQNESGTKVEQKTIVDEIKDRGELTMAMGGKYPPFNFYNDKNELDGFDVDIAKEIAKRLGVEAKPVTTEWDAIITGLLTEKYDIILGSMSITEERQQKAYFAHYYTSGAAVIVPKDSAITGGQDLKGKVVGVGLGTTFEKKAMELGAEVKTYSSSTDALTDMINGRLDAVISDKLLSAHAIKEKGFPFKIVGESLFEDKCGIAIRKEDKALSDEIEKILEDMRKDGTYTKISEKWFGIDIR